MFCQLKVIVNLRDDFVLILTLRIKMTYVCVLDCRLGHCLLEHYKKRISTTLLIQGCRKIAMLMRWLE